MGFFKVSLLLVACALAAQATSPPESPAPAAHFDTALQQEESRSAPQPPAQFSDAFQQRSGPQVQLHGDLEVDFHEQGRGFNPQGTGVNFHPQGDRFRNPDSRQGTFSQARPYGQTSLRQEGLHIRQEVQGQRPQGGFEASTFNSGFQEDGRFREEPQRERASFRRQSVNRGSQKYEAGHGDLDALGNEQELGSYQYSYDIRSEDTGDMKYHKESRDGDKVTGEYRVKEPDGSMRIVKYTADKDNGFQATVEYVQQDHEEEPEFGMKMPNARPKSTPSSSRVRIQRPVAVRRRLIGETQVNDALSDRSQQFQADLTREDTTGSSSADEDMSLFVASPQGAQFDSHDVNLDVETQQFNTQKSGQFHRQAHLQSEIQSRFRNNNPASKERQEESQGSVQVGFEDVRGVQFQQESQSGFQGQEFSVSGGQSQEQNQFQNQFQNQQTNQFQRSRFPNQQESQFQRPGQFQNDANKRFDEQSDSEFQRQRTNQFQSQDSSQGQEINQFQIQDNQFVNQKNRQFQNQERGRFQNQGAFRNQENNQFQIQETGQFQNQNRFQNQERRQFYKQNRFQNQEDRQFHNQEREQFQNQQRIQFQSQENLQFQDQEHNKFQNQESQFKNQDEIKTQENNQFQNQKTEQFQNQDNTQFQIQDKQQFQKQENTQFQNKGSSQYQNEENRQSSLQGDFQFQSQGNNQIQNQFQDQEVDGFQKNDARQFQTQDSIQTQSQGTGRFQNQGSNLRQDAGQNQAVNRFQASGPRRFLSQGTRRFRQRFRNRPQPQPINAHQSNKATFQEVPRPQFNRAQQNIGGFRDQENNFQSQERKQLSAESQLPGQETSRFRNEEQYPNADRPIHMTDFQIPGHNRRPFVVPVRDGGLSEQSADIPNAFNSRPEPFRTRMNFFQNRREFQGDNTLGRERFQEQFRPHQELVEDDFHAQNNQQQEQVVRRLPEGHFQRYHQQLQTQRRSQFGSRERSESTNQQQQFDNQFYFQPVNRPQTFNQPQFPREPLRQRVWMNQPETFSDQDQDFRFYSFRPNDAVFNAIYNSPATRSNLLYPSFQKPAPFPQRNAPTGFPGRFRRPVPFAAQRSPQGYPVNAGIQREYQETEQFSGPPQLKNINTKSEDAAHSPEENTRFSPTVSLQQEQPPFEGSEESILPEGAPQKITGNLKLIQPANDAQEFEPLPAASQHEPSSTEGVVERPRIPGYVRPTSS